MVDPGQIAVVSAFMFVSGVISMKGLLFPSPMDPVPDIVMSGFLGAITGGFALLFLSAFTNPAASNAYGITGMVWLLGAGLVVLFKLGELYA